MRRKYGKLVASITIVSLMCSPLICTQSQATPQEDDTYSIYDTYEDESFISMDEDGNVTVIPLDELDTFELEELEAIDNLQYEVILEVEGESSVIKTLETETEAEEVAEVVQGIIDEKTTVGEVAEEIVQTIEVDGEATPVEIVIEDDEVVDEEINEDDDLDVEETSGDLGSEENEQEMELVFAVTTEAASTESDMTSEDTGNVEDTENAEDVGATEEAESTEEVALAVLGITTGSAEVVSEKAVTVITQEVTQEVEYGVVIFTASGVITYEDVNSGAYVPYVSKGMSPDAAYLGTTEDGKVMFMQSGIVGLVDASKVSVIDYDTYVSEGKITSYYYTSQGKFYHAITTNMTSVASAQVSGYQQDYMSNTTNYYSYDGHYFYTSYKAMIKDYKNNTYKNAINTDEPYYNYYMYLSHRTTTEYTAEEINEYINYRINYSSEDSITSSSKLVNIGSILIENQNTYGANALLMLGVAINESGWGMSTYAQERNNLFGHKAYDSDPDSADIYTSVAEGVMYHARNFISYGYLDATTDARYHGSHLGNKQSGINVKYASDPYWGEKAAANAWLIEMYYSDEVVDAYTETLGIVNNSASLYETPNGTVLYELKNYKMETSWEMPVIVLESVQVGDEIWYKIQSDMPVSDDRTSVIYDGEYSFEDDYVYILASEVYIVSGDIAEVEYAKGDVDGDGDRDAIDYMLVKNHILGRTILTGEMLLRADVNGDGEILATDYMLIKNHILGRSSLD